MMDLPMAPGHGGGGGIYRRMGEEVVVVRMERKENREGSWEEDGLFIPKFWTARSSQSLQSTLQKSSTFYEIKSNSAKHHTGHHRTRQRRGLAPAHHAGKHQCRVV
jgi:hypothetical protein